MSLIFIMTQRKEIFAVLVALNSHQCLAGKSIPSMNPALLFCRLEGCLARQPQNSSRGRCCLMQDLLSIWFL